MDPLQEYNSIILNRQRNPLPPGEYCEVHHIIPRSCGGCNEKWNLVELTPEDHYKCHELLPFIYTEGEAHAKMVYAWVGMKRVDGKEVDRETYGKLKREYAIIRAEDMKGNKYRVGTSHTERSKQRISESCKGRRLSETAKKKIGVAHRGLKWSEETKKKMSEARKRYWEKRHQEFL